LQLNRIDKTNSYWGANDMRRLRDQIKAIDVELAYRLHRMPLI